MKHLVVDARAALPQTDGLGTYLREIVPRIVHEGQRARDFRTTILASPQVEAFWRTAAPSAEVLASTIAPMKVAQNWQIPRLLAGLRPDLAFYPAHDPPLFLRTPFVFTIHDVTLFRLRPYFERLDRTKLGYLKVITPAGLRRARAVLAVSETTKAEIGAIFGRHLLAKVHVTPNGIAQRPRIPSEVAFGANDEGGAEASGAIVGEAGRENANGSTKPDRLLYVGTDRPHKNVKRVLAAYALARASAPDLPRLEIVGGMRSPDELAQIVSREGIRDHVVFRGHISDADLEAAYARALALIFPSLAEGFGLPILEAMARGVPVLTSNISACAEVADSAALCVDPLDERAIAGGILQLFRDAGLRTRLIRDGYARAARYTWDRTATQTLSVLRACLTNR